jgi:hypothetical protein
MLKFEAEMVRGRVRAWTARATPDGLTPRFYRIVPHGDGFALTAPNGGMVVFRTLEVAIDAAHAEEKLHHRAVRRARGVT